MSDPMAVVGAAGIALYAAHHVGDYWVQTDHQARHKGDAGWHGVAQCLVHVITYVWTQFFALLFVFLMTGYRNETNRFWFALLGALAVSGITHYVADRREHGLMFRLIKRMEPLTGKASFMKLGAPRDPRVIEAWFDCARCKGNGSAPDGPCSDCLGGGKLPSALTITDNPSLGTGAWALDQSWHIFWGVFVPALILGLAA